MDALREQIIMAIKRVRISANNATLFISSIARFRILSSSSSGVVNANNDYVDDDGETV